MNLLQRLSDDRRVQLANAYADRYPSTYARIIEGLEYHHYFTDAPYMLATEVCTAVGVDLIEFPSLFQELN